ncbi:DUF4232 domain-containing protein [Streptomyces scopuliridis]|uniref:DUF4232 domain-containing protein n=1 Tax=Streptomyces scopuliridis TaxID=452529 RepID=UPI0036964155
MRTIRHRAAAAAVTALVASLALTACGSGEASAAKDSGGSTASAGTPQAEQETPADNKQQTPAEQISSNDSNGNGSDDTATTAGGGKAKTGNSNGTTTGAGTSGTGTTKYTACTGDNTKVKISQVSRPINHLLLTVTNAGGKNCDAYWAPALNFDDAQAATQIIEDSKPQAVVTLAPGESAYASIALNGDGSPDIPAKKLTVYFAGRDNQGSVGSPSGPLTLPAGTLIADNTSVTYWQANMADALTW